MTRNPRPGIGFGASACCLLFGLLSFAAPANAQTTLTVSNYGVDNSNCGAATSPCRSISQAITNAPLGAQIVVGPGRYGDLNGDGAFGGEGEEQGSRESCLCVVNINKRVTVISRDGALQTVIDGSGSTWAVVSITARAAVLGSSQHGFTITGSTQVGGVVVTADRSAYIVGNIIRDNAGSPGIELQAGTGHQIFANTVTHNAHGIVVLSSTSQISGNYVSESSNVGIFVDGTRNMLENNVVFNNLYGFQVTGVGHLVRRNSIIGNHLGGITVNAVSESPGETRDIQILNNNIYGNSTRFDAASSNCPLTKGGIPGVRLDARNNFWGSASGPGADPADAACNLDTDGQLITTPFVTAEVPIKAGATPPNQP